MSEWNYFLTPSTLLNNAESSYRFVDLFNKYEDAPRDYGDGNLCTMAEVHLLAKIDRNAGITATELCEMTGLTKGAISQILSSLDRYGYIMRVTSDTNKKSKLLYVTPAGKKLCVAHENFDIMTLEKLYCYLLRDCTAEEIQTFYKVLEVYNTIMEAGARKRKLAAEKEDTTK